MFPDLIELINTNNNNDAASKNTNPSNPECQAFVNDFNSGVTSAQNLTPILNNPDTNLNIDSKNSYNKSLTDAINVGTSAKNLMQSQCNVENSNAVLSAGQKLNNDVERFAMALAPVLPVPALVGVGFATAGRMVVAAKNWLKRKGKNSTSASIKDSQRYVSDLCKFRELTYKYDEIVTAKNVVKVKDPMAEKNLIDQRALLVSELAGLEDMITCTQAVRQNIDSLTDLSNQLAAFLDKPASQQECINILTKYADSKSSNVASPIETLAKNYNCSLPESSQTVKKQMYFCDSYRSIEEMFLGNIYTSCESKDFQEKISAKFISLKDIIMRSVQEDLQAVSPAETRIKQIRFATSKIDDELQQLNEDEQHDKNTSDNLLAAQSVMEMNRANDLNTSKSIVAIGRNILGDRFDAFAKNLLASAASDIKEANAGLKNILSDYNKINGTGRSLRKMSDGQKEEEKNRICRDAQLVKKQFVDGYKSGAGLKDICDFTKGDGIPPLVSLGENFDSYSASVSNRDKNITSKCNKITQTVTKNNATIRAQINVIFGLGCGN